MKLKHASIFPDRIRFNWGYHDGAQSFEKKRPYNHTHFDKAYLAGVQAGRNDAQAGTYAENSDAAWKQYNSPEAKQARRMARYR